MVKTIIRCVAMALTVGLQQALAFDIAPTPGSEGGVQLVKCEREYVTLVASETGSVTVEGDGQVDILLVGGGGGGGASYTDGGGAGGGAGGFVFKQSFDVTAGTYEVKVGQGGAIGVNGGDSTAFGLIAHGGGHGAQNRNQIAAGNGGSGGGATAAYDGTVGAAGKALGKDDNLGHDGGSVSETAGRYHRAGGGGGAGEAGHVGIEYGGGGGKGRISTITGRAVWYAGGGAGTFGAQASGGWQVKESTGDGVGGLGGGGNAGCAGTDGLGGGGGGDAKGGNGIVIIRYRRSTPDVDSDDFDISADGSASRRIQEDGVVMVFGQDGDLTVTGGGYVDILLIGGGGGGGKSLTEGGGAGGGAGGLVYRKGVYVEPGTYSVKIGAGGAIGANGADTKALGFVAYGGGAGANNRGGAAGVGGSGGGQTVAYDGTRGIIGKAVHADELNIGYDGGSYGSSAWYRRACGGGGAGEPGHAGIEYGGGGGTGVVCRITGKDVWYAGGGAGTYGAQGSDGWKVKESTGDGVGGLGGGGNAGCAGTDGLGGGGGGDAKGGSGVVIVRIAKIAYPERFEDATGGVVKRRGGYRIHTFKESGTFTMPAHAGKVDILVVGGGGGGGASYTEGGGAGGGAGGLVYKESVFLTGGEYDVVIGQGGAVGANGGDSTAFGLVAHGGGHGAQHRNQIAAGNGGSGGGATANYEGTTVGAVGKALGTDGNLGHDGGSVSTAALRRRRAGGGGGAGDPGHAGVEYGGGGGTGVVCRITGRDVWYAGGGAGTWGSKDYDGWKVKESTGDGVGGLGGGGNAGCAGTDGLGGGGGGDAKGGSGVVIVRYACEPYGTVLIVR